MFGAPSAVIPASSNSVSLQRCPPTVKFSIYIARRFEAVSSTPRLYQNYIVTKPAGLHRVTRQHFVPLTQKLWAPLLACAQHLWFSWNARMAPPTQKWLRIKSFNFCSCGLSRHCGLVLHLGPLLPSPTSCSSTQVFEYQLAAFRVRPGRREWKAL